jgi:curved DNA-binding protein CbpA
MSIEINFDTIKYNLYELLNVQPDSDDKIIKKSFMRIIKQFHPDKNSELEEDIYYHIILANQILLNKESRKKYDAFLFNSASTFDELKSQFNKHNKHNKDNGIAPNIAAQAKALDTSNFNNKIIELNNKHGFTQSLNNPEKVLDRYTKIKNAREVDIKIDKIDIKTTQDFNKTFETNKIQGLVGSAIIELPHDATQELSTFVNFDNYTNLNDIDKLYIEDSIQSSKFSSLDRAFKLHPKELLSLKTSSKSFEERMADYNTQTKQMTLHNFNY